MSKRSPWLQGLRHKWSQIRFIKPDKAYVPWGKKKKKIRINSGYGLSDATVPRCRDKKCRLQRHLKNLMQMESLYCDSSESRDRLNFSKLRRPTFLRASDDRDARAIASRRRERKNKMSSRDRKRRTMMATRNVYGVHKTRARRDAPVELRCYISTFTDGLAAESIPPLAFLPNLPSRHLKMTAATNIRKGKYPFDYISYIFFTNRCDIWKKKITKSLFITTEVNIYRYIVMFARICERTIFDVWMSETTVNRQTFSNSLHLSSLLIRHFHVSRGRTNSVNFPLVNEFSIICTEDLLRIHFATKSVLLTFEVYIYNMMTVGASVWISANVISNRER